jgi:hypothetical protein
VVVTAALALTAPVLSACGTSEEEQVRDAVSEFMHSLDDKKQSKRTCELMTARAEAQITTFLRGVAGGSSCASVLARTDDDDTEAQRLTQQAVDAAEVRIRDDLAILSPRRDEPIGLQRVDGDWRIDNVFNPRLQRAGRGDPKLAVGSDERQIRATLAAIDEAVARKDYKRACLFLSDAGEAQLLLGAAITSAFSDGADVDPRKATCATALRSLDSLDDDESVGELPSRTQLRSAKISVDGSTAAVDFGHKGRTAMIHTDGHWLVDADYGKSFTPAQYERCWRDAGATIAASAGELRFADENSARHYAADGGRMSIKGGDWRIFYAFPERGQDPGLGKVLADPRVAGAVAYVKDASEHPDVVRAARDCGT